MIALFFPVMQATDILGYIHNSSVYEPFVYLMEILQGDFLFNSDVNFYAFFYC